VTRVVVIGAGIAGLAAAWELSRRMPAAQVLVLEGAAEIGGKLRTRTVAGIPVDVGAEALLARRPEGVGLIEEAGLAAQRIDPLTTTAQLRVAGMRVPLPARTLLGIPADLSAARSSGALTDAALARVAAEPSAQPMPTLADDVAVGALVRERLGNEVTDRLVEPLLGGVYAGHADQLSLRATMPALAIRLARDGGSLVRAAQAVTDAGAHDPAAGAVFTSLVGGLGTLPPALARTAGFTVRTSVTVRSLRRYGHGFVLECGPAPAPELVEADAVVVATPAGKASQLLRAVAPYAAADLRGVESASVAIVTVAYRNVAPPPGSGLLIAAREGFTVKAVTLSSQKWPIATGGLTVLRASVGRAGEAAVLQREDAELIALVRHELRALVGIEGEPVDAVVTRWGGGLPQYAVGHMQLVARVRAAVAEVDGLAVCGATYDGVGIPACIASGRLAAEHVAGHLAAGLAGRSGTGGE
jgi:oxygen-dependent protoporphyrinogen oxidase